MLCHAGDMVYLEVFGKKFLMINSFEVASELLNKRSSIYSSRPHYVMVNELCVSAKSSAVLIAPFSTSIQQARMGLGYHVHPVR